ncbi:hypothetical protein [Acinetobacter baumannii]|uniref:hypothetical protein n=1 Tax=Acinetobacter baumannii TaxID=470 RepID=UPI003891DD86
MKLKLDIKSNAIDSFNEALAKFKSAQEGDSRGYKFAILHLSHTIELILKMYLQSLDENLVFSKCYAAVTKRNKDKQIDLLTAFHELKAENFQFDSLIKDENNPFTVNVGHVLDMVKHEKCSRTGNNLVDQKFIDDINWMKGVWNAIEHFEFEFTVKEVRLCIGRLIQNLDEFSDIFSLLNFQDEIGKENYNVFKVLVDEYERALNEAHIDVQEAKEAIFRVTRPKERMFIEWNEYECDECNNLTMIPNPKSSTGYRCTYCGNEESGQIEVDCDVCGVPCANQEMTNWGEDLNYVCPRCRNPEAY